MIDSFGWDVFAHPPYSPDLSPSDNHIFPKLKEFLGEVHLDSDEEIQSTTNMRQRMTRELKILLSVMMSASIIMDAM